MVDIHTHILPHLDDGAKDTKMARAMFSAEVEEGVQTLVLTSHYYGRKHSPERFLQRRNEAFERLKGDIPNGLNVRLGAEVHFTGLNVPDYDELCKLAIEDTKYILIEFPFTEKWSNNILSELYSFVNETGYTPIIAHVERYREVLKQPSILNELVNMGCLLQVNAKSFSEKSTRKFAFALLKHGFVHCIGSDAHDLDTRAPNLSVAKTALISAGFEKEWETAQENMRKIVKNEEVEPTFLSPIKKILCWYK